MERGAFAAPHESGNGPTLPTWALQQVVSYLRYCGRADRTAALAVFDPQRTPSCRSKNYTHERGTNGPGRDRISARCAAGPPAGSAKGVPRDGGGLPGARVGRATK